MSSRAISAVPLAAAIAWAGSLAPPDTEAASQGYPPPPGPYRSGPVLPYPVVTSAGTADEPAADDTRPGMLLPETQAPPTDSEFGAANLFGAAPPTRPPHPPADAVQASPAAAVPAIPATEPAPRPRRDFSMDFRRAPGSPGRFGGPAMPGPAVHGLSPGFAPGYGPAPRVDGSPPVEPHGAPYPPWPGPGDRAPNARESDPAVPGPQAAMPQYDPVTGPSAAADSTLPDNTPDSRTDRAPGGPMFRPPDVTAD